MAMKWHHGQIKRTEEFQAGSFRTIRSKGDSAARLVIGRPHGSTKTEVQAILLPAAWSHETARQWAWRGGFPVRKWFWANPSPLPEKVRRALESIEISAEHVRASYGALDRGELQRAKLELQIVGYGIEQARQFLALYQHSNPGEQWTSASTHIREALVHLVQADKEIAGGNSAAALEAVEAAADHIDKALGKLDPDAYGTPPANPCTPESNTTSPAKWNPGPDDNPVDPKLRKTWLADARARGVPAVEWQHPTAGRVLSYPKRKVADPDAWRVAVGERIKQLGGRVVHWYPAPGKKRNPSHATNPRQLVILGDVLELHFEDGKGYRWKRGEQIMATPAGAEDRPPGSGHLILVPSSLTRPARDGDPSPTAGETFETWHAKHPSGGMRGNIPGPGEFGTKVARVKAIVYFSKKWGVRESYIHKFAEPFPLLSKGPRGTYDLHGGKFRITARGIVD